MKCHGVLFRIWCDAVQVLISAVTRTYIQIGGDPVQMDAWTAILRTLPASIAGILTQTIDAQRVTELRIRRDRGAEVVCGGKRIWIGKKDGFYADETVCERIFENLCRHSLYSVEHQLRDGYITIDGGVRVGVTGHARGGRETASVIMPVTSFCFRVARQVRGCAQQVMRSIENRGNYDSVLVLSGPGAGKTTMLRDMARLASEAGKHVVVLDERGELAGMVEGVCAFDLGPGTDVMDSMPKAQAAMLALRAMAPEILVCDELGDAADASAMTEAGRCGVCVFASAHASDIKAAYTRPALASCVKSGVFTKAVILDSHNPGRILQICSLQQAGCAG